MKNRLQEKIKEAAHKGEKLFCAFLTLGFPNLTATSKLIEGFEKTGVDIMELGFPFSDPLADGPTLQYSSEAALANGVEMHDAFDLVRKLRKRGSRIPILFFTYFNPVFHYGLARFVKDARQSGFDGLIVPDLPPGEEKKFIADCRRAGLDPVFLIAPTTGKKRAAMIARESRGFIYYVSLRGVTGARKNLSRDIRKNLRELKKITAKPVLIGFGVSSPVQGRELSRMSEGVIVGSAIVDCLRKSKGRITPAVNFARKMVRAVKGAS